jgi:mono/diheme cytochrome c family protein
MLAFLIRFGALSGCAGLLLLVGCYTDNEERLYGPSAPCNSAVVTYRAVVAPIIQQHCLACHGTGSAATQGVNLVLEGYDKLQPIAANGLLLKTVRHEPGVSPMPKGSPKLSDCNLNTLQRWVDAGMPNN